MRTGVAKRVVQVAALAAQLGVVVVSAAGIGTATAHPPAPFGPSGAPLRGAFHTWLHQAKAPLVRGRLRVLLGRCPGAPHFVGCIFTRRPRTIYLSPAARRPRAVLYHELGHTFDLRVLAPRHRKRFKRLMGIHGRGWFSSSPPAAEHFADAYALCAQRKRIAEATVATAYGYRATPRRHRRACALIRDAASVGGKGKKRRRPARPPGDAPPVAEPREPPPPAPPGSQPPPSGPYQPPGPVPDPPPPGEGDCGVVERLLTGCEPG